MMNMTKVGRTISALRKEQNMTQMELAERLGVTYQAVSNWERGASMPDIVKLPELSRLFHVTIDELLGESSPIVTQACEGTIVQYCQTHEVSAAEITDAAPLLKPDQIDTVLAHSRKLRLEDIGELIPFLDQETVDRFARSAEKPEELEDILPFVSGETVDELLQKFAAQGEDLEELYPFATAPTLEKLARNWIREQKTSDLDGLYPFLSNEALEALAKEAAADTNADLLEDLAPFLRNPVLEALIQKLIQDGKMDLVVQLAPYLNSTSLSRIIRENLE